MLKWKKSVKGRFSLCEQQPNLTNSGCVSLYKMQQNFKKTSFPRQMFRLNLHNQEQLSVWRGVVDPSVRNSRTPWAGKHLKSQIVRWASQFYCCLHPNHGPHSLRAKTRAIYNLLEIWDPIYFVFYTSPAPDMAPSVFTSIISPCLAGSGCWKLRTDDGSRHHLLVLI